MLFHVKSATAMQQLKTLTFDGFARFFGGNEIVRRLCKDCVIVTLPLELERLNGGSNSDMCFRTAISRTMPHRNR